MGTCDAPLGTGCIRIYSNTTQFNGTMGFCGGLANQTALMASNLSVANLSSCSSANARNMGVCHCDSYNYCNVEPMLNGNGPPSWLTNTRNEVMADVETQQLLVEVVALHKAVLRLEKEKLSLEKSKLEYEITNLRAETLYK